MDIKKLNPDVISKIRSSFSINSVAQCVFELVCNSLDAKSTSVAVRLNLVTFKIQVADNGDGITKENMELLGIRYMTSKCRRLEDLDRNLKTYGFRGETIANIVEMCKSVSINSRFKTSSETYSKILSKESKSELKLAKPRSSVGTTVTVLGWLSSVPVRQKRIVQELELGEVKKQLESLVIINPGSSFTFRNDVTGMLILNCSKSPDIVDSFRQLHPEVSNSFTLFKVSKNKISVEMLIQKELVLTKKLQYIYVNKRPVKSSKIQNHVFKALYSKNKLNKKNSLLFDTKRYPVFVMNIKCPPSYVDNLLKPLQIEVGFTCWELVISCIDKIIKTFLGSVENKAKIPIHKKVEENLTYGISQLFGAVQASAFKRKSDEDNSNEYDHGNNKVRRIEDQPLTQISPHNKTVSNNSQKENYEIEDMSWHQKPTKSLKIKSIIKKPLAIKVLPKRLQEEDKMDIDPIFEKDDLTKDRIDGEALNKQDNQFDQRSVYSRLNTNEDRGKNLIMDMFLKSTQAFKDTCNEPISPNVSKETIEESNFVFENNIEDTIKGINTTMSISVNVKKKRLKNLNSRMSKYVQTSIADAKMTSKYIQTSQVPGVDTFGRHAMISNETPGFHKPEFIRHRSFPKAPESGIFPKKLQKTPFISNKISEIVQREEQSGLFGQKKGVPVNQKHSLLRQKSYQTDLVTRLDGFTLKHDNVEEVKDDYTILINTVRKQREYVFVKKNEEMEVDENDEDMKYKPLRICHCTEEDENLFHFGEQKGHGGSMLVPTLIQDDRLQMQENFANCQRNRNVKKSLDHFLATKLLAKKADASVPVDVLFQGNRVAKPFEPVINHAVGSKLFSMKTDVPVLTFQDNCDENVAHCQRTSQFLKPLNYNSRNNFSKNDEAIIPLPKRKIQFPNITKHPHAGFRQRPSCNESPYFVKNSNVHCVSRPTQFDKFAPVFKSTQIPRDNSSKVHDRIIKITSPYFAKHKNTAKGSFQQPRQCHMQLDRMDNAVDDIEDNKENFKPCCVACCSCINKMQNNLYWGTDNRCTLNDLVEANYYLCKHKAIEPQMHNIHVYSGIKNDAITVPHNKKSNLFLQAKEACQKMQRNNNNLNCQNEERVCTNHVDNQQNNNNSKRKINQQKEYQFNEILPETNHNNTSLISHLHDSPNSVKNQPKDITNPPLYTPVVSNEDLYIDPNKSNNCFERKNEKSEENMFNFKLTSSSIFKDKTVLQNEPLIEPTYRTENVGLQELNTFCDLAHFGLVDASREGSELEISLPSDNEKRKIIKNELLGMQNNKEKDIFSYESEAVNENKAEEKKPSERSRIILDSQNEWLRRTNDNGRNFFVNKRTGMVSAITPVLQQNRFEFDERLDFVPKGMSPVLKEHKKVDKTLSQNAKSKLHDLILEGYEDELMVIKWKYFIGDDPKTFFEEIYREKTKLFETCIPVVHENNSKTLSNCTTFTFTNDLFRNIEIIGQVDKKFIAVRQKTNNLLILFDQHAVHERIRVEKLLNEYRGLKTPCKEKLTIFLPHIDLCLFKKHFSYVETLGLGVEFFNNGIHITHMPLCIKEKFNNEVNNDDLRNILNALIKDTVELLKLTKESSLKLVPKIIQNIINLKACRGAIKFGDALSIQECIALLNNLSKCNLPFQCAHGRPTLTPLLTLSKFEPKMQNEVKKINLQKIFLK